jgi:hypothetical protein
MDELEEDAHHARLRKMKARLIAGREEAFDEGHVVVDDGTSARTVVSWKAVRRARPSV